MKHYIYLLKCPLDMHVMYVGKSINPDRRLQQHCISAETGKGKNKGLNEWIKCISKINKKPILDVIEECDDASWEDRERYWIKFYKSERLLNIQEGGISIEYLKKHPVFGYQKKHSIIDERISNLLNIKNLSFALTGSDMKITKKKCPKNKEHALRELENILIEYLNKHGL